MSDTDTDTDRLSARLAAVERALTDRACDCAHESFTPHDPPVSTTHPTDDERRDALVAVCEYVLARERASDPSDEHTAAVRAALDSLTDSPSEPPEPPDGEAGAPNETPREWLERVATAVFG